MLIDDGQWHEYSLEFDVFGSGLPGQVFDFSTDPPTNDSIRLIMEDNASPAGDAFFDNVQLSLVIDPVPTASNWGLVVMALLLLGGAKVYFNRHRVARA